MEAERKRVANELRSTGSAEAEKIRADADRQREVILAEAYRDAQKIKGEGDAKAAAHLRAGLPAESGVLRVLPQPRGLRQSFRSKTRRMVLEPNSDFFKYLKDAAGKPGGEEMHGAHGHDHASLDGLRADAGDRGPAAVPRAALWRETFRRLMQLTDGQIRFIGLTSMLAGLDPALPGAEL